MDIVLLAVHNMCSEVINVLVCEACAGLICLINNYVRVASGAVRRTKSRPICIRLGAAPQAKAPQGKGCEATPRQ